MLRRNTLQIVTSSLNSSSSRAPAVRFSADIERLQEINRIRNSPLGVQLKRVIDLLLEKRQALTPEQINETCYVDLTAHNNAVFESLKNNPKVTYDGKYFSYKPMYVVKGKNDLLILISKTPDGIPVADLMDAYKNVIEDLKALESEEKIWLFPDINTKSYPSVAYPNIPPLPIKVDDELKDLFYEIKLPKDFTDIEKDLKKHGINPLTDTIMRRAKAEADAVVLQPKPKSKAKEEFKISKRTKLTNSHLPELFEKKNEPRPDGGSSGRCVR